MRPRISVIIPSFKPDNYIDACLASLAVQTIPKESFEVIVILNGCEEPWKTNLSQLLERFRIEHGMCGILLHSDWGNVSNARNMGLAKAKAEYICFIDDDDYVSPTFLEKLLDKANERTISLCHPIAFNDKDNNIASYVITDEYLRHKPNGLQRFYKAKKYFQGPWMKLIHKDIIGNRMFDTRFTNGEDSMFMFLISDRMKWIDFTDDDAIYYRRIRAGGAHYSQSRKKRHISAWNKFRMFTKYYFSAPWRYNFWFYITRLVACVKTAIK